MVAATQPHFDATRRDIRRTQISVNGRPRHLFPLHPHYLDATLGRGSDGRFGLRHFPCQTNPSPCVLALSSRFRSRPAHPRLRLGCPFHQYRLCFRCALVKKKQERYRLAKEKKHEIRKRVNLKTENRSTTSCDVGGWAEFGAHPAALGAMCKVFLPQLQFPRSIA